MSAGRKRVGLMRDIVRGFVLEWSVGTECCKTLNGSGAIGAVMLLTSLRYGICGG